MATMMMMFRSGLTPDEESKLDGIEDACGTALIVDAGCLERIVCFAVGTGDLRRLDFVAGLSKRTMAAVPASLLDDPDRFVQEFKRQVG